MNDTVTLKYKPFILMTDDVVRELAVSIFNAEKVTKINRSRRTKTITCVIQYKNHEFGSKLFTCALLMKDPFLCPYDCLDSDDRWLFISKDHIRQYLQFCTAKGMIPWLEDNPFLPQNDRQ